MIFDQTDMVDAAVVARLAACLDMSAPSSLPPLWHWLFFLDAAPSHALSSDGHRGRGVHVHHDPDLPSRMWAGGRVSFFGPIAFGAPLRRESTVVNVRERQGRTGRLQFVTMQDRIFIGGDLVIEEEQDLVYRGGGAALVAPSSAPPAPPNAVVNTLTPNEVLLFRFSALTFNAHRIHYDLAYATMVEHYPGLVVHGPLQAVLLAEHLRRAAPGVMLRRFEYRGHAPAFAGQALHLEAWPDTARHDVWHLQTRAPSGAVCLTAQAEIVQTPAGSGIHS
jgi:3-methylfumaryl-CoA hydratase